MKDVETVRTHLKREVLNHLANHPTKINLGIASIEDLCLSIGKLLCWVGGTLDGNDSDKRVPLGHEAQSVFNLGEHFREAALQMMEVKPRNRYRTSDEMLSELLARVESLERKDAR